MTDHSVVDAALSRLSGAVADMERRAAVYIGTVRSQLVLIVDDNEIIRRLAERTVKGTGFDFVSVGSIAEARVALSKHRFGLAILDMNLPDGDGWSIAESLPKSTAVALMSGVVSRSRLGEIAGHARADAVVNLSDVKEVSGIIRTLLKTEEMPKIRDTEQPAPRLIIHVPRRALLSLVLILALVTTAAVMALRLYRPRVGQLEQYADSGLAIGCSSGAAWNAPCERSSSQ